MKLSIENLSKEYPNGVKAIDELQLEIGTGMFGLLGPNGAGKSSLMRTIATLQKPDTGSITFDGINVLENPMELRKILGYLPQQFGVYPKMSALDLLHYLATLKGIHSKTERNKIVQKVLEITNLYEVRKKNVSGYSGGMKQRFGIAQLLLNNPKLIIVDEPTAGLDPAERHRFLNVLREVGTNSTVIFSTHIVDDVKELCNAMAILNGGKILMQSTPKLATEGLQGKIWSKEISREAIENYENNYTILSTSFTQDDQLMVRAFSETDPENGFQLATAHLEDVYYHTLNSDNQIILNQ
ncbi:MAG: ABC transporter ATP-binding protein [Flavobacteriales bacterium]|jgi:ABC-type multidrug transport system ATPase subunit|nr:ABC transporter ATP-binding protein [Flavobacteriales bacterium]